jgi:hypothetical protein
MPIVSIVAHRHEIRFTLLLVNLALFIVLLTIGTLTSLSQPFAQQLYDQIASIPISPVDIFLHNMLVCLLELIPLFGILMLALSGFATGIGVSAISLVEGRSAIASLWVLVNQFPHTWLEFLAYTLAATEGTMVFLMLIAVGNRLLFRRELKIMALTFLVSNLLLTMGSVVETGAILVGGLVDAIAWIISDTFLVAAVYYDARRRGMQLPNPLIPLVLVGIGTVAGFALPTLLAFAVLIWIKHMRYKGVGRALRNTPAS